jgi:hypothetical protein
MALPNEDLHREFVMNTYIEAKIETCLELCESAKDFKKKVKQVTSLSDSGFEDLELTKKIHDMLSVGHEKELILRKYF